MQASHKAWQAKDGPAFTCFCSNIVSLPSVSFFFFFFYLSPDTNNKGITAKALCSWTLFLGRKWFAFHACSEWQQEACLLLVCCFGLREGGWIAPCTSDRKTHHLSSWTIDLNSHDNSLFLIIHLHGGKGPELTLFLLLTSPQPKIALHVGRQVGKLHTTFKLAWTAHYYNIIWSGLWVCSDWLSAYVWLYKCIWTPVSQILAESNCNKTVTS